MIHDLPAPPAEYDDPLPDASELTEDRIEALAAMQLVCLLLFIGAAALLGLLFGAGFLLWRWLA